MRSSSKKPRGSRVGGTIPEYVQHRIALLATRLTPPYCYNEDRSRLSIGAVQYQWVAYGIYTIMGFTGLCIFLGHFDERKGSTNTDKLYRGKTLHRNTKSGRYWPDQDYMCLNQTFLTAQGRFDKQINLPFRTGSGQQAKLIRLAPTKRQVETRNRPHR